MVGMVRPGVATLVVDIGSCMFTGGFAGDDAFRAVFPSVVACPSFWHQVGMDVAALVVDTGSRTFKAGFVGDEAIRAVSFRLAAGPRSSTRDGDFLGRLPLVRRRLGGALDGQQLLVVEGLGVAGTPGV